MTLPAHVIVKLYKMRWQVELFFKWIKQHLRIKSFFGTSGNAVKTQSSGHKLFRGTGVQRPCRAGQPCSEISRYSHALAVRQVRCTVLSEIPSDAAVSGRVRPA